MKCFRLRNIVNRFRLHQIQIAGHCNFRVINVTQRHAHFPLLALLVRRLNTTLSGFDPASCNLVDLRASVTD